MLKLEIGDLQNAVELRMGLDFSAGIRFSPILFWSAGVSQIVSMLPSD